MHVLEEKAWQKLIVNNSNACRSAETLVDIYLLMHYTHLCNVWIQPGIHWYKQISKGLPSVPSFKLLTHHSCEGFIQCLSNPTMQRGTWFREGTWSSVGENCIWQLLKLLIVQQRNINQREKKKRHILV